MCARRFDLCAHLALDPLILLCIERSTHFYVCFLLILLAIPINIKSWKYFCILYILYMYGCFRINDNINLYRALYNIIINIPETVFERVLWSQHDSQVSMLLITQQASTLHSRCQMRKKVVPHVQPV